MKLEWDLNLDFHKGLFKIVDQQYARGGKLSLLLSIWWVGREVIRRG